MKSWSVWMAAVMIGGLLGWATGAWSSPRIAPTLPLLDVAFAAPPGRLSPPEAAAEPGKPTATPTAGKSDSVRAVIDRELPHATADEREIWFEQLKELPPGVVEDLLNVRKQFREMVPPLVPHGIATPQPLGLPLGLMPAPLLPPVAPEWQASREAIEQLRTVTLHNLANADTIGYRRVEPLIETDAARHGILWHGTRLDLRPAGVRSTGRLLDVAIDGEGWFAVEDGDGVAVTRRGTFIVRDGQLMLPRGRDRFAPLLPRIAVPESVERVEILPNGEVGGRSLSADTLQPLDQIELAQLSEAGVAALDAGQPLSRNTLRWRPPATGGMGRLVTGSVEPSNVIVAEERERLQWIDDWLRHIAAPLRSSSVMAEPPTTR